MEKTNFDDAYLKALSRISRREQSSLELRRYLARKGFEEDAIAHALRRLLELGYLNDERYARALARSLIQRGKGPRYVAQKLAQKGVALRSDEIQAESEGLTGQSDLERAREIVERRYPDFAEDPKEAGRAYQALVRRGFSFEIARRAVQRPQK